MLNLGVSIATPVANLAQDFGYTAPGQNPGEGLIGDRVWLDIDGDGVQDPDEPGIEGVTVTLLDSGNNVVGVTTTDENGNYYFGGLVPGTYTVVVTPPAGLTQTYDATPPLNNQSTVTIGGAFPLINLDQDFGYRGTGTVGDLVWNDLNANGVVDSGEAGIAGVTLDLYWDLNGNGTVDPGEPLVGSTTTNGSGGYLFSGLPVDDGGGNAQFVVDVTDTAGVLVGYWHSLGTAGLNNNSQIDPYAVTLTPGAPNNLTADFGYYILPGAVGNRVWLDDQPGANATDGNGIQNAGEPGIGNVKVTLTIVYPNATVTTVVVVTDGSNNGYYSFGNLLLDEDFNGVGAPEPTHTISVVLAQPALAGLSQTLINASGSTIFNDSNNPAGTPAQPFEGQTNTTFANDNATISSYDFGYLAALEIGDYVWQDLNYNGLQDANEPGIPGVLVTLYDGVGQRAEHDDDRCRRAVSLHADQRRVSLVAWQLRGWVHAAVRLRLHAAQRRQQRCDRQRCEPDDGPHRRRQRHGGQPDVRRRPGANGVDRQLRVGGRELGRLPGCGRAGAAQHPHVPQELQHGRDPGDDLHGCARRLSVRQPGARDVLCGRGRDHAAGGDGADAVQPARCGLRQPEPKRELATRWSCRRAART